MVDAIDDAEESGDQDRADHLRESLERISVAAAHREATGTPKPTKARAAALPPPQQGMAQAERAIWQLKAIPQDDLDRDEAFKMVLQWIDEHEAPRPEPTRRSERMTLTEMEATWLQTAKDHWQAGTPRARRLFLDDVQGGGGHDS